MIFLSISSNLSKGFSEFQNTVDLNGKIMRMTAISRDFLKKINKDRWKTRILLRVEKYSWNHATLTFSNIAAAKHLREFSLLVLESLNLG